MRRYKVIICVVVLFSLMSMRVFAIPQSDIDLLVGIGYTLLGPSLGLLSYGLLPATVIIACSRELRSSLAR